jgi:glycosyltransferase involved in cell wall biosynthesis
MVRETLASEGSAGQGAGICIIVENCASPGDPRVWQEAIALTAAGYRVSIICPKAPGFEEDYVVKDGIEILRHFLPTGSGVFAYLLEYSWALVAEMCLALRVYRRTRFRFLQACNPPDTIFLIALVFKLLFGTRFIFDHHDPAPEFYECRFQKRGFFHWILRLFEKITFRTADIIISTNSSLREIAIRRGGVNPARVFVVRTCPDRDRFQLPKPRLELKEGRAHLVLYLGNMGPQDGLDLLLDSIDYLVNQQGRRDTTFVCIGPGSQVERLKAASATSGLDSYLRFTGPLYGDDLLKYLATADVGVAPDPSNLFNDQLTMLKIMDYMVCGLPTVLYDLKEGRRTAGEAALYARNNDPIDFARHINQLLDDRELRGRLGAAGARRTHTSLNWNVEKLQLLHAFQAAQREPSRHTEPAAVASKI